MKHNEQEIKAMVKKAYSAATPDVLESVLSDCKKLKGRVTPMNKEKLSQKHHCGGGRGSVRACRRYRLRHISKGKQSRFNRCTGREPRH